MKLSSIFILSIHFFISPQHQKNLCCVKIKMLLSATYLHTIQISIAFGTRTVVIKLSKYLKIMAALVVYALVSCFTLLVLWYFKSKYEKRNFPPGPPSLPLVGCTPFLKTREGGRNLMLSVDLIPKYGDIIGYDFGPMK